MLRRGLGSWSGVSLGTHPRTMTSRCVELRDRQPNMIGNFRFRFRQFSFSSIFVFHLKMLCRIVLKADRRGGEKRRGRDKGDDRRGEEGEKGVLHLSKCEKRRSMSVSLSLSLCMKAPTWPVCGNRQTSVPPGPQAWMRRRQSVRREGGTAEGRREGGRTAGGEV